MGTISDSVPKRVYAKLFAASYLSEKRIRIRDFTSLVDFLCWEQFPSKSGAIEVHALDDHLQDNLKDASEKVGFQFMSRDLLLEHVAKHSHGHLWKYYFYNFIIYTKASLDSIAVVLNLFFKFGFVRGQIDFGKGSFVEKVEKLPSFSNFSSTYRMWVERLTNYRDAIIHQKSVDLYPQVVVPRVRRVMIPFQAFSHEELLDIEESLEDMLDRKKKDALERMIRPASLRKFLSENVMNTLEIMGCMSTEVLKELKKRYPDHKPSTVYYR